jgi:hypothetical protein
MIDLFGEVPTKEIPMMPEEYKGDVGKGCGFTKSKPREWTDAEIGWIQQMRSDGYSNEEIGQSTGRTAVSIQIKLKRLGKREDTYNEHHLRDKYQCNREFYDLLKPQTILDMYCGVKSYWRNNYTATVTTNDQDADIEADYHERAEMLIHRLYYEGNHYDVIDLDPYGSAYECFDLAIKMATKGLIITLGELGHKRWKRLDYVKRYYGIDTMEDFTLARLVEHIEMIANRNKKHLVPVISRTWDRIGRVWFRIEELKITEQWD